jgi:hypothetical protein
MAKFVKGMHGIMREYVEDYGTSDLDPRFTVIPSALAGDTQGRNVTMKDVHHPDIEIRDIEVDEGGGEQVVAVWNPAKPKERKVLRMVSEEEESMDQLKEAPIRNILAEEVELPALTSPVPVHTSGYLKIVEESPAVKKATVIQGNPIQLNKATSNTAPTQLVKFYTSETTIGFKYHEVILKGISLVLIYDKDYEAAIPPEFTTTEEGKTFRIEVVGYPYMLNCMYYGQSFEHNNFIYTLFAIFDAQELKP